MRLTFPVNSPADYEKIDLTLLPNQASLLQLTYPGVSEAIIKDYKLIETQMEVEIFDSNENNQAREDYSPGDCSLQRASRAYHQEQNTRACVTAQGETITSVIVKRVKRV